MTATKPTRAPAVRGYVGLELEIEDSDIVVKRVVTGGPAERAGIARGDLVRGVDDLELDAMQGPQWVLDTIERRGAGRTVDITLERDGEERTLELELGPAPRAP